VNDLHATHDPRTLSCAQINGLIDRHIGLVRQRLQTLRTLERQLTALRRSCDGDGSHPCTILESFFEAAQGQACACHAPSTLDRARS